MSLLKTLKRFGFGFAAVLWQEMADCVPAHQITNRHLRVMVKWGQLECSPYYHYRAKRSEIRLWDEGLHALEGWLLSKGIISL